MIALAFWLDSRRQNRVERILEEGSVERCWFYAVANGGEIGSEGYVAVLRQDASAGFEEIRLKGDRYLYRLSSVEFSLMLSTDVMQGSLYTVNGEAKLIVTPERRFTTLDGKIDLDGYDRKAEF